MKALNIKIFSAAFALAAASFLGATSQAARQVSVNLNLHDRVFNSGAPEAIRLKQLLQNQYPQLDLRNAQITDAQLVAKSRLGNGEATLTISGSEVSRANIPGHPQDFNSGDARTFYAVNLSNRSGHSQGTWQIDIRGNVIARSVRLNLILEGGPGNPGGRVIRTVATGSFQKVRPDTDVFSVNVDHVQELRIIALNGSARVTNFVVTYASGESIRLNSLIGNIPRGGGLRVSLNNRNIRRISVTGISPLAIAPDTNYRIEAVVPR